MTCPVITCPIITCHGCGAVVATSRPITAACGHCGRSVTTAPTPPPPTIILPTIPAPSADLACLHRGHVIGSADPCPCQGDTRIYTCDRHTTAQLHRLAPGIGPKAVCDRCHDRTDPATATAIITTHFNPARFRSLAATWSAWLPTVGHPVQTIEALTHLDDPELPGSIRLVGSTRSILWQKEALINWALSRLPDSVRYVAWLDHDLVFDRPDWLAQAAARINGGADAVQLFDRIRYLERDGTTLYELPGAAAVLASGGRPNSAPGGAWMASRRWLDSIGGLYASHVVGGGDATFFVAVTKCDDGHTQRQTPRLRDHSLDYINRIGSPRWDYVPGQVTHLWHGDASHRQYITRDDILRRHDFDPLRHIATNPITGLLEWTSAAPPALITEVRDYFTNRREDAT